LKNLDSLPERDDFDSVGPEHLKSHDRNTDAHEGLGQSRIDKAFMAGLLYDIRKLILLSQISRQISRLTLFRNGYIALTPGQALESSILFECSVEKT